MRLLVVVNVFEPDLGGGVLFSDLCYGLAERGFEVTVRCAYPYYPEWTDKSGRNGLRIQVTEQRGVRIERFGLFIPPNPHSLAQRLAYEGSFFASLMRRLPRRGEFDGMMAFCPLMGGVAYAAVIRRRAGLPFWLNVQDLPAEAAAAGGIGGGGGGMMMRIQDSLFNEADVWSTISPIMVDRLVEKRRHEQPILYLPNWLHRSLGDRIASQPPKGTLHDPVRLFYSGNLGTKQNLIELCRILHESQARFHFRIQAEGSSAAELREFLTSAGDPRFDMRGLSDEDNLAAALHASDLAVITERSGTGGSFIPSKLIPALASETPVLAVCDASSPLGREMEEHGPGIRVDWHEAEAIPNLLSSLKPDTHAEWRAAALRRADFYRRDRVLDLYERELREFLDRGA